MLTNFFLSTLLLLGLFISLEAKSPWIYANNQLVDGPTAEERAVFFNNLWKDFLKQNPSPQKAIRRPEIMPTIAKARRAPLEAFDEWEGMMESLDNLRKPRFGR